MIYTLDYNTYNNLVYNLDSILPNPYMSRFNVELCNFIDYYGKEVQIGWYKKTTETGQITWQIIGSIFVPEHTCNKTGLIIDKINGNIAFNMLTHTYWDITTGMSYISVTTLLNKYKQKFDSITISMYKAIEQIYPPYIFKIVKNMKGKKLAVDFFLSTITTDEVYKLEKVAEEIRHGWSLKGYTSTTKGTAKHAIKEHEILNKKDTIFEYTDPETHEQVILNDCIFYPEVLIFSEKYKIAGQIDLVIVYENATKFMIIDYKTNAEILKSNKYQKMNYPFENLDDCSYNHYSFQLSMYALIIMENPQLLNVNKLTLSKLYLDHITDEGSSYIECINLNDQIRIILDKGKNNG